MEQTLHASLSLQEAIARVLDALTLIPPDHPARAAVASLLQAAGDAAATLDVIRRSAPDLMLTCKADGTIAAASDASCFLLGWQPAELIGLPLDGLLLPEDRLITVEALRALPSDGSIGGQYCRGLRRDGAVVWLEWSAARHGSDNRLHVTFRDATVYKQYQRLMQESEQLYQAMFEHSPDAVFSLDAHGRIVSMNPACERISGYVARDLIGIHISTLLLPERNRAWRALYVRALAGKAQDSETAIRHRDGHSVAVHVSLVPLLMDGQVVGILGVGRDITERIRAQEQLAHLAFHDPLTGLANRSLFMSRLELALAQSVRGQPSLAVLYLDLDDFKIVNDSLGHRAGDTLLVEAARRLRSCVGAGDTVARLGGDEFTVLLEGTEDTVDAIRVAQRILHELQMPYLIDGHKVVTTPSVGVVMGNQGQDAKELLRYADIAMYKAKQNGKARYEAFTPIMYANVLQRLQLETDLRRAIDCSEFRLRYQPIVDLDGGALTAVEALVRWEDPVRGIVSPAEFIPLAEETGLILPIGRWVLEEACRQARIWQEEYPDLVVSVNLSARQFQEPFLAAEVGRVLQETGLKPRGLQLEITETVLMQDGFMTQDTLRELKEMGLQLAMDDFGTGYSSLSYLRRFPIDVLKIDRSFIRELGASPEDTAVVHTVIMLAKALKLKVTGEGIETSEQVEILQAMGCDRGQGYLFSHPLTSEAVDELLRTRNAR